MSKYTTGELVDILMGSWRFLLSPKQASAIIAKLRAADKLCEAAVAMKGFIPDGWEMPLGFQQFADSLKKAIAEYEGENK